MPLRDRVRAVTGFVSTLAAKWRSAPPIEVVATPHDLPVPAPSDARGLFWRRRVYIVADQPTELIAKTLNHEVVAHHGLRQLLGSKWHAFMAGLHRGMKAGKDRPLRRLRDHVKQAYVNRRGRCTLPHHLLADEVAAAAVEDATHAWTGAFKPRRAKVKERFGKVLQMLRQRSGRKLNLGYHHLIAALEAAAQRLKVKRWTPGQGPQQFRSHRARRHPQTNKA